MRSWPRLLTHALALCSVAALASCASDLPLAPVNRSPTAQSLIVTPTTLAPGDSAIVVCRATDPDGDPVVFDWTSFGSVYVRGGWVYNGDDTMVVYASASAAAPVDTGWVRCSVRDRRGGWADAGVVQILIVR